jgi:hypothetical protein
MVASKIQSVKLNPETVNKLLDMKIEIGGVELKTYDDKVSHLIWFFQHYKN